MPKLPPPRDYYNRPAKELAGYQNSTVIDGEEVPAPIRTIVAGEAISLLANAEPTTLYQMAAGLDPYHFAFKRTKYNVEAYNYARLTIDVTRAGAAGSLVRLYYSPSGLAGTWISVGLLAPIECPLSSVGIIVAGGFILADL